MEGLPLEDTFGDIVKKAMRGTGTGIAALAGASNVPESHIGVWLQDKGRATQDEAHALARALRLDPAKLAESADEAWYPPDIVHPRVHRHAQRPHPSNGYVFTLEDDRRAVLVDPAGEPAHLLRVIENGGYDLQYVLITHKHSDHCDAAPEIAAAYPNATIVMHPTDAPAIGTPAARAKYPKPGETLAFGNKVIRTIATPGHTDGSICFTIDDIVFTGDTLFAASVGGTFGTTSTYADLLNSVATKLFTLPPDTIVMPGHGPATTMALAQSHNAFFARA
jgi:glyoxylase-like metal-dependent hydrolase (beta-lactamase superfamily II)